MNTHSELYHWYRGSVLRCGLPTRIVWFGAAVITLMAFVDPDTASRLMGMGMGMGMGLGVIVFLFYAILNCFFNVDYWLFKKELEYDHPEHYGPGGEAEEVMKLYWIVVRIVISFLLLKLALDIGGLCLAVGVGLMVGLSALSEFFQRLSRARCVL